MTEASERARQILQVHAPLIHAVVDACHNRELLPHLEEALRDAADDGWAALVAAVRLILAGRRDDGLLTGLDDEDRVIVTGILEGLRNPATLPALDARPDAVHAAPGLARLIAAARRGDVPALQALANMGEQMSRVSGDMAQLAAKFRVLVNGERDADVLTRGMGARGRGLMFSILEELGKLERH